MNRTWSVESFIGIPRILFKLLVAETQTAVLFVNVKNYNVDFSTNSREFRWMLYFLGPREIADVD